ncbi:DUF4434 domain-containing protein [Nonomuraea rhizosphaerae]|uniref:DUF4434 domain-containing protein n=1 Tax=Nonomuraea rhizosphaerae TaxID=2665663 RepID=UPI001C602B64|nr:DUF4434 domain-containing protein [Nonomuraea rhizosphaerae]
MAPGWILRAVAAVVTLFGTVVAVSTVLRAEACPERDTRVSAPYAITGYWVVPRSDPCVTRRVVEAVHDVGGDTLVTFGPRLAPATVDGRGRLVSEGGPDPFFTGCLDGGRTCYQAARAAVPEIRRVYGYVVGELFGDGILRCPGLDKKIESRGRTYYRLLLGRSCARGPYDLVLVSSDGDGVGNMVAEAAAYGMKVFPGLPAAPQDVKRPWLPDLAHLGAVTALTERVLTDYRTRFGASFAGVYQSFELAVKRRPRVDPVLSLYKAQHAVAARVLPGKKILVSPYFDARRTTGYPPALVAEGFAAIAGTRQGLPMAIAVQDGRGTGKLPVHGPEAVDAPVDPRLAPVVGNVTNRQAYHGATREYFAAAAAVPQPGVELWANTESFEPSPVAGECGRSDPQPLRGRTTKKRLDSQVMAVGPYVTKVITYGWDPFFTCQQSWMTPSLSDDLHASWDDPLVLHAYRQGDGLVVDGRNLEGGTVRIAYAQTGGRVRTVGVPRGRAAWVPFAPPGDLDPGRPWLYLTVVNGGRASTNAYVLR